MPKKCDKCKEKTYCFYPWKKDKWICGECKDKERDKRK